MTSDLQPPSGNPEIQFDRAEFTAPAEGLSCRFCRQSLRGEYFDLNQQAICGPCRGKVEEMLKRQGGTLGFLKAAGAGCVAAVAGAILYFAIREITGYEIGLISILVGWGVGRAVHWGSRGKGGWVYQSLAVFLTYLAIVSTYVPLVVKQFREEEAKKAAVTAPAQAGGSAGVAAAQPVSASRAKARRVPSALDLLLGAAGLVLLLMALPFLGGLRNILGLLIIGFGLYQAWKLNRRPPLAISGPFQVGASPIGGP